MSVIERLKASTHLAISRTGYTLADDAALLRSDRVMFIPAIDGTVLGGRLYDRAQERIFAAFNAGDRRILNDLPRVLSIFTEEATAIDRLYHLLRATEEIDEADGAVFVLNARANYVQAVAAAIRIMIDRYRDLAEADEVRWTDAAADFADADANIRTLIVAAMFDDVTKDPFGLQALRAKGLALLHRLMIAGGVAEWVERPA